MFSSAILALDSPTRLHVDNGNIGMALAFAVGDFTGGRLMILCSPENDYMKKDFPVVEFEGRNCYACDITKKPLLHNGSEVFHGTEPYTGIRVFIGLYNVDQGIKGKGIADERSERIKNSTKGNVRYLQPRRLKAVDTCKKMLLSIALDESQYEKESLSGNGKSHSKYGE